MEVSENWLIFRDLHRLLGSRCLEEALAKTEDVFDNNKSILRGVFVVNAARASFGWTSVQSLIRVNVQMVEKGQVTHEEDNIIFQASRQSVSVESNG